MTSASELFHNRRSRIGRNDSELGFGSSFSFDRPLPPSPTSNHQHQHQHQHQHSRRRSRHHHQNTDGTRRSSGSRHIFHREHESVRLDHGAISAGNSSASGASSSRTNRIQFARSDQLPGDVLLARERLVERLRGVSLSSTSDRQSTRSAVGAPLDEVTYTDEYRLIEAMNWESGPSLTWLAGYYPNSNSSSENNVLQDFCIERPRGLSLAEVNSLHREVFTTKDEGDTSMLELVLECSICLDSFSKGEELIRLPCEHKFHSACLCPWVRSCGDCPNCRAGVIICKE